MAYGTNENSRKWLNIYNLSDVTMGYRRNLAQHLLRINYTVHSQVSVFQLAE